MIVIIKWADSSCLSHFNFYYLQENYIQVEAMDVQESSPINTKKYNSVSQTGNFPRGLRRLTMVEFKV